MLNPGDLNGLFIETHHLHFRRAHKRFGEMGIGEGQPRLLRLLADEDGLSQVEIAKRSHLEPATITVALGRLEKLGLIERVADKNDQRVTRINLTPAGCHLNQKLKELFLQLEEECFEGFSPDERQQLADFLMRMKANLQSSTGAAASSIEEKV